MRLLKAVLSKAAPGFLLVTFHLFSWAAAPVAFVADFRGDVTLDAVGRPPFLAELPPGSRLALGAGATAAVMYVVSGEEYALKGPGEFSVARDGVKAVKGEAPSRRVSPVRASGAALVQTSKAATASLRMRSAQPPKSEPAGPRYPVNAKVATLQPTLRWGGNENSPCQLAVSGLDGRDVFRGNAKGPSFRLPVKLTAGTPYVWSCKDASGAVIEARFDTLALEAIQAADRARGSAKGFTDRVALALLLQELGAAHDAREVWAQLASERPDIPEIAVLAR